MDLNNTLDLPGFWSLYVVGISLVGILGCGIFLWMQGGVTYRPGETTGHVWDETLQEYSNPLPNWWRWLFYITVLFSLGYLALYPGLGSYGGQLGWSMRGQYDGEVKKADDQYGPIYKKFLSQDIMTVAANPEAREIGQRLFLTYCAQCHGSDAKGNKGFPNLTDNDWLWGGTPDKIKETITKGRDAVMTPKGTKPDMDAQQVKDVVAYVRSLSGMETKMGGHVESGRVLFSQACTACHGQDAKGNSAAGFPNLTDKIWLYGSDEATMIEGVTKGRINRMPAWGEFLGEGKVHILAAYVWGLGGGVKPVGAPPAEAVAAPAEAK